MKVSKNCINCGTDSAKLLYDHLMIVKCLKCGLVYRDAEIKPEHYEKLEKYEDFLKDPVRIEFRKKNAVERLDWLEKFTNRKKGKILDIGTNEGFFLEEATKRGYSTLGCEPNVYAGNYARALGIEIINKDIENAFEELKRKNTFDFITLFHVIEHLPDPSKILKMFGELLSEGSLLIIEVPDIESPHSRIYKWDDLRVQKEHMFYFTKSSITALLKNNGFEIVFSKRRSYDEYDRPFLINLIRMPVFMQLYMAARYIKSKLMRLVAAKPPIRKSFNDNTELWTRGKMVERKYLLSRYFGKLISYLNLGDDLYIVARKAMKY